MTVDARICAIDFGEPTNLNVHSGGTTLVMCVKSAGRCGSGLVSARKANFWGSNPVSSVILYRQLRSRPWSLLQSADHNFTYVKKDIRLKSTPEYFAMAN
jgi:hypothetical protein